MCEFKTHTEYAFKAYSTPWTHSQWMSRAAWWLLPILVQLQAGRAGIKVKIEGVLPQNQQELTRLEWTTKGHKLPSLKVIVLICFNFTLLMLANFIFWCCNF